MFETVLIANRGEIALRIARTCREMGIRVVAVYSTEDEDSAVVRFADEAVRIGPADAKQSYLLIPAVIEAAKKTGAQAIHPGYGFLSEDPDFAEICAQDDVKFIGPSGSTMQELADKSRTRALMRDAGVPVLPGSTEPLDDWKDAKELADEIGYPVLLKAVAGGGGRGIGLARDAAELRGVYRETRSQAQALFGDGRVYLERFVERVRHIEVQVLCDAYGNGVHLGERDCSLQRRRQKLVEESPAPGLPPGVATKMGELAVQGALAVGYEGAGTFEFVVDEHGAFHLIEVNCRLQVEHPVTEMVTGFDLVAEQLKVAAGEPLSIRQQDVEFRGTAIEGRINAENPALGFVPTPGVLETFEPAGGPFVRVDSHGFPGMTISPAYDSLLAKLIVWAPDRERAIARFRRAIGEFHIAGHGVSSTASFLSDIVDRPVFRNAEHHTNSVEQLQQRPDGTH
ncbi:acetyl-CoA carboxylase biotin carboxylase subunit [Streptomyces albidus (ex Kaewkla and Franco 2022)]|uniref:acetyl-CoA carboxylase biotin carboxylase subunit n=1 Tax=Streptomyces albidus (ex Kaewkla and Franco 2022) TaxID=722709 RepID=UPI0015EEAB3F|nr:acetyl-CoA carboxylase biotin carboxylase subunit [Streptomyces albidus (ex Kaewkla and Franco 2022)]